MTLSRASRDAGTFPALVLTLLLLAPVSRAADVAFYLVAKGLAYDQTSTAQPVPKGSPDRFTALVGVTASNSPPEGSPICTRTAAPAFAA